MVQSLLVVEYEPRYIERLERVVARLHVEAHFARDAEEALRLFGATAPRAVVVSWILPKASGADLIRDLRSSPGGADARILLTVSGYSGGDPAADARRAGADDLLPKPFDDDDLADRIARMLEVEADPFNLDSRALHHDTHPAAPHPLALQESAKLTANEIFGDVLEDAAPPPADDEIDRLLDRTVVSLKKKAAAAAEFDRLLDDTLSGLVAKRRKMAAPDRVHASSPVLHDRGEETITARPGARLGQFVLREKIATGGMAEVWKARMEGVEGFEKLVAIKRILPHLSDDQEFVDMFVDEAKIAARLNHPNIIHIYDLGRAAGSYYIAMELVDGHDLKSTLRRAADRGIAMPPDLAVFVAAKIGAALDFAHRKAEGLVHRDVSPQNVLVSWEGDIKLCDFGIAKATSRISHTRSGALKGKVQYMSPEQASAQPLDRRSDVFSLGLVLFEMLTGRKAFGGESEISVLDQVRLARIDPPSSLSKEVPAELDRIVATAVAREPSARYASAGDLVRDLEKVLPELRRPAPSAADLAAWMARIWSDDV
ncbi:MAG: protein kinase domain-containing protein [Thermoanaerobaculia bacterium]